MLRAIQALDGPEFHPWIEAMPEPVFTKRIVDDSKVTDHHALIPTAKRPDLNRLSDDETKIYRLIAKRLLEVFYPPYEYEITEAILICQEERFLAKGKVVLEPGYTVLSKKRRPHRARGGFTAIAATSKGGYCQHCGGSGGD
ncbi:MAG: DNA topoisomerase [Clostridia bacterium]